MKSWLRRFPRRALEILRFGNAPTVAITPFLSECRAPVYTDCESIVFSFVILSHPWGLAPRVRNDAATSTAIVGWDRIPPKDAIIWWGRTPPYDFVQNDSAAICVLLSAGGLAECGQRRPARVNLLISAAALFLVQVGPANGADAGACLAAQWVCRQS